MPFWLKPLSLATPLRTGRSWIDPGSAPDRPRLSEPLKTWFLRGNLFGGRAYTGAGTRTFGRHLLFIEWMG